MPINLTDENFIKEVQKTDKMALVDFYATWCEPCSLIAPVLEKLEKEFEEKIVLLKANVDNVPFFAQKYQVSTIPMVVLFKNSQPISGFMGFKPEPIIKEWLEKMIKDNMSSESSEDKQENREEMIKYYSEYAEKNGFHLNPERQSLERIIKGLSENEKKYGRKYCPCRRITGNQEEDSKKICPCFYHKEEISKDGRCLCGLFVK